jgi:hypothetical protein
MKDEFDLFEKFRDGSSLWRDSVLGFETTRLMLQELVQKSENQFYGINLRSGEVLVSNLERHTHRFRARPRAEKQSKN